MQCQGSYLTTVFNIVNPTSWDNRLQQSQKVTTISSLLASVVGYLEARSNNAVISFPHVAVGNIGSGADNSLNLPPASGPPLVSAFVCSLSPSIALAHGWLDSAILDRVRHLNDPC